MTTHLLYFSPTGGSKKVADLLCADMAPSLIDISKPDTDYSALHFSADDVCVIVVPSYGGRVPAIALDHIRQMHAAGTRAVLVTVYGNRDYDDTLLELKQEAEALGFQPVAAIAAVAEHSIVRRYGSARPDAKDAAELREFAQRLPQILAAPAPLTVPGNFPYREYNGVPLKPKASSACSSCGLCAKHCPAAAIPATAPATTDTSLCISCMRCIAICPVQARKLNPIMTFVAGFQLRKVCAGRKANSFFGSPVDRVSE